MKRRILLAAPIVNAIALYAAVADAWLTAALLAGAVVVATLLGPRVRATPSGQWLSSVVTLVLVFAVSSALSTPEDSLARLATAWSGIAVAALLHAAMRLALEEPHGGPKITYTVGLVAVIACGEARSGSIYTVAVCGYLLTTAWVLRAVDDARPSWARLSPRSRRASVLLPLVAAGVAWAATAPLAPLHQWVQGKFEQAYLSGQYRVGFTDRMKLGAMERMLSSDEVVLRVYGPRADYLRGVVYDHYSSGRWTFPESIPLKEVPTTLGRPAGGDVVEVRRVSGAADRYFVPFEARAFGTVLGAARFDSTGIAFRAQDDAGRIAWFRPGERDGAPVSDPEPKDTELMESLYKRIAPLAAAWTAGAPDVPQKLARIAQHLETEYRYSLHVERSAKGDPLVDFLFVHREGHCEYFATAMAMLARSLGIPARVVGGYRVVEHNPIGNYHVVREKNAHAWVEAYLPGFGWRTYDATPSSAQPENFEREASIARAVVDALASGWDRVRTWLVARSVTELWSGAAAATVLLALVQWLRGRGAAGREAGDAGPEVAPPLPYLERLLAALESHGVARAPSETLERYARRVADVGRSAEDEAARLIARYAAWRYGGQGDEASLARDMDALTAQLSARRATEAHPPGRASTPPPAP